MIFFAHIILKNYCPPCNIINRDYFDNNWRYDISFELVYPKNGRDQVMKKSVTVLITIFLIFSTAHCLADEKKDHICFRALDSNKDGFVTLQEFEKF